MKIREPRQARITARQALLAALAASALAAVLGARYAAQKFTAPAPVETRFLTPWELCIPHENVSFQTEDGLTLRGWWLPRDGAKRTIVTLAGYNSAMHHTLGIGSALWRRGANVLLFDSRGRGDSEGSLVSLGHHEKLDALAAVEHATRRNPNLPLGLMGYSMGGAVAIMAAAKDERIKAVVADSPFASQRSLLLTHVRNHVGPFAPAAVSLARRFVHYDIRQVEPIREVEQISAACMFIHGELDKVTAPEDSISLYKAAKSPKELWLVEGAGHVEAYFQDRQEYSGRVAKFFDEHLG